MSLGTSNRDGGRTSESGHLRAMLKGFAGEVLQGLAVSQRGAGANMSVDVAIGDAIIPRSDATYGHPSFNDAVYNQAITTADVSNPRRDMIVMYIDYGQSPSTGVSNNTNGVVKIKVVTGTPAGSPADPSDAAIQSSVGASNPYIKLARVRVAAAASSITNSVIDDLRTMAQANENGGWNSLSQAWDSWAYSAWDSTNKLGTINVPDSSIFTLGQKVRYWQLTGGWKYGFVVRKPNGTSIQVYQGHTNGYTLNNERVYLPAYSRDKVPDGFPIDPAVWTVQAKYTADYSQSSPVSGTWYNNGSQQIALPVGCWDVEYEILVTTQYVTAAQPAVGRATLSTANNSESDSEMTSFGRMYTSTVETKQLYANFYRRKHIAVTSNTPYYLNIGTNVSGQANVDTGGTLSPTIIRAVCAYL